MSVMSDDRLATRRRGKYKPGDRIGRLTVIRQVGINNQNAAVWLAACDCGASHRASTTSLTYGKTRSCGCFQRECASALNRSHGHTIKGRSPEYRTWGNINARCGNQRNRDYAEYGARGIIVCDRWRHSFETFLTDMGQKPSSRHSIDRIDGAKGYSPENCRWATADVQNANTISVRHVVLNGCRMILSHADRMLGLCKGCISRTAIGKKISHQEALDYILKRRSQGGYNREAPQ
jgi:hypothetical protein